MRILLLAVPVLAVAQILPVRYVNDSVSLIAPASNNDGSAVVFAAAMSPDGATQNTTNLYLFFQDITSGSVRRITSYSGDFPLSGITSLSYAAGQVGYVVTTASGTEEVHTIDASSFADRTLVIDKQGCIQPLCVGCEHPCVGPVHLTADAGKVLYAVARQQPFWVVNSDGTNQTHLPVYSGALAPSPQRVISRAGVIVFTSSAPSGPTFAAAAIDVHVINLDGTGLRPVTRFGNSAFSANNATIAADGSLIAFESNYSPGGPQQVNQIWLIRADGTGLRQLSTGTGAASNPSISADGSIVTFLQNGQIKRVNTTAAEAAPLALTGLSTSAPRDAVVTDNGAHVVFSLGPQSRPPAAVYQIFTNSPSDWTSFARMYGPPFLSVNGVASASSYGAPSAGSLISVYGANLARAELTVPGGFPLPNTLGQLSLVVNGQPVPLAAVTPWQINAQLPQTVATGSATLQAHIGDFATQSTTATIESFSPSNFAYQSALQWFSYSQAAAFHAGTSTPADPDHPAASGETLEIYCLGLGATNPQVDAGQPSPSSPPARAVRTPRLQIGGRDVVVTFAGLVPGLAGVYQVNAVVPTGLQPGLQYLSWPESKVSYSSIAVK